MDMVATETTDTMDKKCLDDKKEEAKQDKLLYAVDERPPIHIMIFYAFQVGSHSLQAQFPICGWLMAIP